MKKGNRANSCSGAMVTASAVGEGEEEKEEESVKEEEEKQIGEL